MIRNLRKEGSTRQFCKQHSNWTKSVRGLLSAASVQCQKQFRRKMRGRTQKPTDPLTSSRTREIEEKEKERARERWKGAHYRNCNCRTTLPMIEYPVTYHSSPTWLVFLSLSFIRRQKRAYLMPDTKLAESCNGEHARCENNAQIFGSERNYEAQSRFGQPLGSSIWAGSSFGTCLTRALRADVAGQRSQMERSRLYAFAYVTQPDKLESMLRSNLTSDYYAVAI